jgi:putative endonuclease
MYTVYVLKSLKDGRQYAGYTKDINRRLVEHNSGKTESTNRRRPFILVHAERFDDLEKAKSREKYLKTGKGREEIKSILAGAVPKW